MSTFIPKEELVDIDKSILESLEAKIGKDNVNALNNSIDSLASTHKKTIQLVETLSGVISRLPKTKDDAVFACKVFFKLFYDMSTGKYKPSSNLRTAVLLLVAWFVFPPNVLISSALGSVGFIDELILALTLYKMFENEITIYLSEVDLVQLEKGPESAYTE